ncbi:MAG TPA: ribosome small subunit-dependent GTPase A [Ktedonobacterales bacterium]
MSATPPFSSSQSASSSDNRPDDTPSPEAAPPLAEGMIIEGSRGLYRVETSAGPLLCTIRGRLRKQLEYPLSAGAHKRVQKAVVKTHDPVAVGDRVRVLPTGGGKGVIEEVIARAGGAFARDDPDDGKGQIRSVAGLDQMIAVFAARNPAPHLRMLDRFLILAEQQQMAAVICLNKVDLGIEPWLTERLDAYRAAGYAVVLTSVAAGKSIEELRRLLAGRTSAFLGPSGVGKSSLLNALQPELGRRVSEVSDATGKGRHTTTGTRFYPLDGPAGGYIADTAGIRALALGSAAADRLDLCFPEFRPYLGGCRLSDCSHLHEPDCAVRAAVDARAIDRERYESYCRLAGGESDAALEDWEEDL